STAARSGPVSLRRWETSLWWLASAATALAMSFWAWLSAISVALGQPAADDGDGLVRILVGDLADLLHGLRVHMALYGRHVDHLGGLAGDRLDVVGAGAGGDRALHVAAGRGGGDGLRVVRRDHALTSGRTTNSSTTMPSAIITSCSIQCMMSSLVN